MASARSASRPDTASSSSPSGLTQESTANSRRPTSACSSAAASGPARKRRHKAATSTSALSGDQHIVCALTESRGVSPTVGLAFINLTTAEAVMCQIADSQTYVKTLHKLHVFEPSAILFPEAANALQKSKLLQVLEGSVDIAAPVYAIARKYWDEAEGVQYIDALAFKEDVQAIRVSVGHSFYASCCFAAAVSYVVQTMHVSFTHNSMRIKYEPSEGSMMIDVSTVRALELIENVQSSRCKASLFGLLNLTITKMGERLLRSNILQPPTQKGVIETRYNAVQELVSSASIFAAIRTALKAFQDVDKVLTQMVIVDANPSAKTWEQLVNRVILVKSYVRAIPAIFTALEGVSSDLLTKIRQLCNQSALEEINQFIDFALNDDVTFAKSPMELRNQRTYAVRAGANGLLDVARRAYKEAQQDAGDLLNQMRTTHDLLLEMRYDEARQYYFRLWITDLEDRELPEVFINRYKVKNAIECQTLDLLKQNQKIVDSHQEVMNMSEHVVVQLIEDIRANIAPLFRISDSVAILDMLAAFAQLATTQNYTRPEITSTLAIKNGRHPIAEKIRADKFVPNDVYATRTKRLQIVTGCNMSGKSTYIRSIALMTVMAQIGCFIPADYASIPIRDQLFARVSLDDSGVSDVSTFAAEMRETAFILRNVDSRSLVIVDELGRGTSPRDGLAIAIAVAEALAQSRAFAWFVTHFRDLPIVLAEREGVVNLHLETSMSDPGSMTMLYRIADGPETQEHYGLALARVADLPADVLEVAERVAAEIVKSNEGKKTTAAAVFKARRCKLLLGLNEQLVQAREGGMAGESLRKWLKRLQDEFVVRMSSLDDEQAAALGAGCSDDAESVVSSLSTSTAKPSRDTKGLLPRDTLTAPTTVSSRSTTSHASVMDLETPPPYEVEPPASSLFRTLQDAPERIWCEPASEITATDCVSETLPRSACTLSPPPSPRPASPNLLFRTVPLPSLGEPTQRGRVNEEAVQHILDDSQVSDTPLLLDEVVQGEEMCTGLTSPVGSIEMLDD